MDSTVARLASVFSIVATAWLVSEVVLGVLTRARRGPATVRDRGSLVFLWLATASGLILANVFQSAGVGSLGAPRDVSMAAALSLLLCGLILRWTAILTLGRSFSPTVAVRPGQKVVQSGVFRHVRHPAYSGLLLAFCGAGVAYGNWLSLVVLLVPVMAALAYRIGVEERMLVETFGHEYEEYRSRTRRLVPFIY